MTRLTYERVSCFSKFHEKIILMVGYYCNCLHKYNYLEIFRGNAQSFHEMARNTYIAILLMCIIVLLFVFVGFVVLFFFLFFFFFFCFVFFFLILWVSVRFDKKLRLKSTGLIEAQYWYSSANFRRNLENKNTTKCSFFTLLTLAYVENVQNLRSRRRRHFGLLSTNAQK